MRNAASCDPVSIRSAISDLLRAFTVPGHRALEGTGGREGLRAGRSGRLPLGRRRPAGWRHCPPGVGHSSSPRHRSSREDTWTLGPNLPVGLGSPEHIGVLSEEPPCPPPGLPPSAASRVLSPGPQGGVLGPPLCVPFEPGVAKTGPLSAEWVPPGRQRRNGPRTMGDLSPRLSEPHGRSGRKDTPRVWTHRRGPGTEPS